VSIIDVRPQVATSLLLFNFSCDVIVASPSSRLFWLGAVAPIASPLTPPPHRTSFLIPFLLPFALFSLEHSAHRRRVVVVAAFLIVQAPSPASMAFPPSSSSILVHDAMMLVCIPRRRHRRQHSKGDRCASPAMAGRWRDDIGRRSTEAAASSI
jgi:hypothetical protein